MIDFSKEFNFIFDPNEGIINVMANDIFGPIFFLQAKPTSYKRGELVLDRVGSWVIGAILWDIGSAAQKNQRQEGEVAIYIFV